MAADWSAMLGMQDDEAPAGSEAAGGMEAILASAWADAMQRDETVGTEPSAAPEPARTGGRELSQDEIDSLLGVSAVALRKEKPDHPLHASAVMILYG